MADFFLRSRPTAVWLALTAHGLGVRRISAGGTPALGIHFEVTTAGTTGAAEPAWNTTVGGTTADGSVTWTTRGSANTWVTSTTYVAGDRAVPTTAAAAADQVLVLECTTGGLTGAEPNWNNTVGGTTADGAAVWTTREATTWDNAHITFTGLTASTVSAPAAGDTVFVGDEHNETTAAAVSINLRGSGVAPVRVLCVVDTGDPLAPITLATTGRISSTGANAINFRSVGTGTVNGLIFSAGDAANATSISFYFTAATSSSGAFENCQFILNSTDATSSFPMGSVTTPARTNIWWKNCTVRFGNVSQVISTRNVNFIWTDTPAAIIGTVPTTLVVPNAVGVGSIQLEGLDFSAIVTGKFALNIANGAFNVFARNCTLGTGGVFQTGVHPGPIGGVVTVINLESGAVSNVRFARFSTGGSAFEGLTNVRTGGASNGIEAFAWNITSDANARFDSPFVSFPIRVWNTATGVGRTVAVEIIRDNVTALTDSQIWLEVEFLGSAALPKSSFTDNSAVSSLATGVAQPASTASWVTTGMANPNRQRLAVTITPARVGLITARVFIAVPSTTITVDPFLTIS